MKTLAAALALLAAMGVSAQGYPAQPVNLIVGFSPGASAGRE